jgi:hypothetical protein
MEGRSHELVAHDCNANEWKNEKQCHLYEKNNATRSPFPIVAFVAIRETELCGLSILFKKHPKHIIFYFYLFVFVFVFHFITFAFPLS